MKVGKEIACICYVSGFAEGFFSSIKIFIRYHSQLAGGQCCSRLCSLSGQFKRNYVRGENLSGIVLSHVCVVFVY